MTGGRSGPFMKELPMATINGTARNDTLNGTNGGDRITGFAGDDRLYGRDGDDQLNGGAGRDLLDGGAGNDWLSAGTGDDILVGGLGTDTLNGGDGRDRLYGNAGSDRLDGGAGDDVIDCGPRGRDTDEVIGGAGNDVIVVDGRASSSPYTAAFILDFDVGDQVVLNDFLRGRTTSDLVISADDRGNAGVTTLDQLNDYAMPLLSVSFLDVGPAALDVAFGGSDGLDALVTLAP